MTVRPPIVVVLGHVDHGKSSLLEAIREDFKITSKESGGITQHIGAYVAEYPSTSSGQVKTITFIDTPGHEAFSAMRSRGAKVADIAILVVAADEGIKPQTKEAIQVIKGAGIPFVVAINKIDKPEADAKKIENELAQNEVFLESLGGTVPSVQTSSTTKQGIKELLEMILLMADLEQLHADPQKPGEGVIIESSADPQRGFAVTALLLDGKVRIGDIVGTKSCYGRVRIIEDFQGAKLQELLPSFPALVIGLGELARVGEEFKVFLTEDLAKGNLAQKEVIENVSAATLENNTKKILPVILKADVAGSLEVLQEMLLALPQENVIVKIVSAGIGEINDNDVRLARSAKATLLAFKTKTNKSADTFAKRETIRIEYFDIVYDLIQRVRQLMEQPLQTELVRKEVGTLRVLGVFFTEKNHQVIGGRILEGQAQKGAQIEIVRNEQIAGRGKVLNLQKDKKDMPIVQKGEECGISFQGDAQVQEGDILHFFIEEQA